MLKDSALVRLLKPWSFRRGSGLTIGRDLERCAARGCRRGARLCGMRRPVGIACRARTIPLARLWGYAPAIPRKKPNVPMSPTLPAHSTPLRRAVSPLAPDAATLERFLAQCHRRRYPTRTDVFRPGDPAGTLYYVVNGSTSIITEEDVGRELVLGYLGTGEFVGEMGLFIETERREVALRTRTPCELAEISYERLYQLLLGPLVQDAPKILYMIGAQLSRRLLDTSRKAGRLAFLDVTDRIVRTLHDLAREPESMSHPQGTQLRVSRQELARLVGCSREMAGRVLKKLETEGKLHARGKTVVLYGTRG